MAATVRDAADRVLESAGAVELPDGEDSPDDSMPTIHLVYTETPGRDRSEPPTVRSLLDRMAALARDHVGDAATVRTARLANDRYLATPHDHAAVLAEYAREHDVDLVVLDPDYSVDATDRTLQPIEHAFDRVGLDYVQAHVAPSRRPSLAELVRFSATGLLATGFYLVVGGNLTAFGLTTSLLAGGVAGLLFRNVTFETTPSFRRVTGIAVRGILFVPYLLVRILTANVQISYLVLHPSLPIDPHLDRITAAVGDGVSVTGLANSLTVTPGTLTVDAERNELLVHSITPETRLELLTGERERRVRFVFFGRAAMALSGPLDRGDVETVSGPTDAAILRESDDIAQNDRDSAESGGGADE